MFFNNARVIQSSISLYEYFQSGRTFDSEAF